VFLCVCVCLCVFGGGAVRVDELVEASVLPLAK